MGAEYLSAGLEGSRLINDNLQKAIVGAAIAFLTCVAAWHVQLIALFAPAMIVLIPVLLSFVSVYSGWYWAAAGAVGCVVCAWLGNSPILAVATAIGLILPVGVQYYTYYRRIDFKTAITINMLAYAALGFIALMIIRAVYGDIGQMQAELARNLWDKQSDFNIFSGGLTRTMQGRYFLINLFMSSGYLTGADNLISALESNPTTELYTRCIDYITYMVQYVTDYALVGNLIFSSIFAGFAMVSWPRMTAVRHAVEPEVPFTPLRKWYLPGDFSIFICAAYALSQLLTPYLPEWWYSFDYALRQCVVVFMCIQGLAAIERKLRLSDVPRGMRGALLFLSVLIFKTLVILIGAMSALFGSQGAISSWIQKHMDDGDGEE